MTDNRTLLSVEQQRVIREGEEQIRKNSRRILEAQIRRFIFERIYNKSVRKPYNPDRGVLSL